MIIGFFDEECGFTYWKVNDATIEKNTLDPKYEQWQLEEDCEFSNDAEYLFDTGVKWELNEVVYMCKSLQKFKGEKIIHRIDHIHPARIGVIEVVVDLTGV